MKKSIAVKYAWEEDEDFQIVRTDDASIRAEQESKKISLDVKLFQK